MKYVLEISDLAQEGLLKLKKSEPIAYAKAMDLFEELRNHPQTGTGKPEFCKYEKKWSRSINRKHRLTYTINDFTVVVSVISVLGHYNDK